MERIATKLVMWHQIGLAVPNKKNVVVFPNEIINQPSNLHLKTIKKQEVNKNSIDVKANSSDIGIPKSQRIDED